LIVDDDPDILRLVSYNAAQADSKSPLQQRDAKPSKSFKSIRRI
jgi:hypothetical protein